MSQSTFTAEAQVGKYLGSQKIVSVSKLEEKTPGGAPLWQVTTDDGRSRPYPEIKLMALATDSPVDATEFRSMRGLPIVRAILDILVENDMELSDWDFISSVVQGSNSENHHKADEIKWGTDRKTMLDLHRVLLGKGASLDDVIGK